MQEMLGGMKFDINGGSGGDEREGGVEGEGKSKLVSRDMAVG